MTKPQCTLNKCERSELEVQVSSPARNKASEANRLKHLSPNLSGQSSFLNLALKHAQIILKISLYQA